MAGLGEHITAMVRSHASGDDSAFYSVALQVAARQARQGHHLLADDIKKVLLPEIIKNVNLAWISAIHITEKMNHEH